MYFFRQGDRRGLARKPYVGASRSAWVLGIGIAWLLVRTDLPGARWLELGFWTAVFLPTLTVLVAWIMVFNSFNGVANELLKRMPFVHGPVFDIWWGIVATHLLSGTL